MLKIKEVNKQKGGINSMQKVETIAKKENIKEIQMK